MKVQTINNQNNISHEAYFKPNEQLRNLYNVSAKTKELRTMAEQFKNNLPKHELEIIKTENSKLTNYILYKIKNNQTQQIHRAFVTKDSIDKPRYGLYEILAACCRLNNTDFFKEGEKNCSKTADIFDIITSK